MYKKHVVHLNDIYQVCSMWICNESTSMWLHIPVPSTSGASLDLLQEPVSWTNKLIHMVHTECIIKDQDMASTSLFSVQSLVQVPYSSMHLRLDVFIFLLARVFKFCMPNVCVIVLFYFISLLVLVILSLIIGFMLHIYPPWPFLWLPQCALSKSWRLGPPSPCYKPQDMSHVHVLYIM